MRSAHHPPPALSLRLRATHPTYPPAQRILLSTEPSFEPTKRGTRVGGYRGWVTESRPRPRSEATDKHETHPRTMVDTCPAFALGAVHRSMSHCRRKTDPGLGQRAHAARTARTCSNITQRSKDTHVYAQHARDAVRPRAERGGAGRCGLAGRGGALWTRIAKVEAWLGWLWPACACPR